MQLTDKRILVTGGASGIGRALVDALLARGSHVGVLDCDEKALAALPAGPLLWTRPCDVADAAGVDAAVSAFAAETGGLDGVVNNAARVHNQLLVGLGAKGLQRYDAAAFRRVVDVTLLGVFHVTVAAAEIMVRKRIRGVIVNVGSIAAAGNLGQSAYSAAKAGVHALTATWAKELGGFGIRVAGIAPGFTRTPGALATMSEQVTADWVRRTPLRRMADPTEIVDGILFLLGNDFCHGRMLEVDGGLRL